MSQKIEWLCKSLSVAQNTDLETLNVRERALADDLTLFRELKENLVKGAMCRFYPAPLYNNRPFILIERIIRLESDGSIPFPRHDRNVEGQAKLYFKDPCACLGKHVYRNTARYVGPTVGTTKRDGIPYWIFMNSDGHMFYQDFSSFKLFFSSIELL